ncbi:penicillin-insensitive murein endopeptidase [Paragemmobacter straminiformis]|uniref:Penicillin-insensitive murein endopeptidase n=1 Tax=Paragemmobacter straminiformis TaxID=2045119 RepID=A0A842IAA6_9RHOB|nr:penicillin-insensitive murein endopeptidase [Gemmobacter straminiformis]MBC2836343.1 penicillin-insensitive murein endopeptidase [Gemmobacter straminiformis]
MRRIGVLCAVLALLAAPALAETKANKLFGAAEAPSLQDPMPIGSYAKGCGAGMVELPESGPSWQAMRLSRNRHYGQPDLVDFIEELSRFAQDRLGWAGLYIGDMSQPRGGPMTSGHASHQIGLDADIWMLPPRRLDLTRAEREEISSVPVRSADQKSVTKYWTPAHAALLQAAASDPRVDRIFVAAAVKIEMCKTAKRADTKWLQKIRPIYGHDTHFHVRLKCPKGARLCETQTPSVSELSKGGNGCDDTLMYWVSDAYLHPKPQKGPVPVVRGPRDYTMADLPRQCRKVLSSP